MIEMGKLEEDVELLSKGGGFTIVGRGGKILVRPTLNIYSEEELKKLGLERRDKCRYYSKERDMTFYLFQGTINGKDAYKIIQIKKGCFE